MTDKMLITFYLREKKMHSTLSGISDSKNLNTLTFNESRTSSLRFRTC